jgi:hypothetical protein
MLEFVDALEQLCGRAIQAVKLEEHLVRGVRSLVSVWLDLGDRGLSLRSAAEGWGLVAESRAPVPADLGKYGRIEVNNAGGAGGLAVGHVDSVWVMFSAESAVPVGARWRVLSQTVVVWSHDDNLFVRDDSPDDLGEIRYELVCGSL